MDARVHGTRRRFVRPAIRPRMRLKNGSMLNVAPPVTTFMLEIVAGPARGSRISLPGPAFIIGGAEDGDGRLGTEPELSERHAQIDVLPDRGLLIEDLRSENGTYVNGVRIPAPTLVRPGDTISVGTTTMRVIDEAIAPTVEPQARPAPARVMALRGVAGGAAGAGSPGPNGPRV